jgi:hypothetical protein
LGRTLSQRNECADNFGQFVPVIRLTRVNVAAQYVQHGISDVFTRRAAPCVPGKLT